MIQNSENSINLQINGEHKIFSNINTLHDLLQQLDYLGKRLAVELNMQIVPKSKYATTQLNNGDNLEIVVAVGGG